MINVDNPKESPTILSLCTGYGGLESALTLSYGKIDVLCHVEIEAFAIANLVKEMETYKMATCPIWTDVTTFPTQPFRGAVDILTGGYPCQPFSLYGNQLGEKDERYIWPYISRIISEVGPRQCFFENVASHLTNGLQGIISDLGRLGYSTAFGLFTADEVGADHERARVFILANNSRMRWKRWEENTERNKARLVNGGLYNTEAWKDVPGRDIWGVDDGDSEREDRIRLLGNGVVPQSAALAYQLLSERFKND